jgi:hypothetical protein
MLVAAFLHPWPEVVALAQTRQLVNYIRRRRAPSDTIFYFSAKKSLYLATIEFQNNVYISLIANTPLSDGKFDCSDNEHIYFWRDYFGVRGMVVNVKQFPETTREGAYFYGQLDLHDLSPDAKLIGRTNVGLVLTLTFSMLLG